VNPAGQIQQLLALTDATPYAGVADLVRRFLANATQDPQNIEFALRLLRLVPTTVDRALQFDNSLLQSLASELLGNLDTNGQKHIMPTYGQEWSHSTQYVPLTDTQGFSLTVIEIQREEGSTPHLDQYVWLVHEVVHFVFASLPQDMILGQVNEKLTEVLRELTYAAFPLRGTTSATGALSNEVRQRWTARKDQLDWSHELAVDAICLWVLGPAYVDALANAYDRKLNQEALYNIEQSHPPVELRLFALLEAAYELGWGSECADLDRIYHSFLTVTLEPALGNRYAALRRLDLIATVRAAAWRHCDRADLPRLTHDRLDVVRALMKKPEALSGITLVLAGWLKAKAAEAAHDVAGFDAWVENLLMLPEYEP